MAGTSRSAAPAAKRCACGKWATPGFTNCKTCRESMDVADEQRRGALASQHMLLASDEGLENPSARAVTSGGGPTSQLARGGGGMCAAGVAGDAHRTVPARLQHTAKRLRQLDEMDVAVKVAQLGETSLQQMAGQARAAAAPSHRAASCLMEKPPCRVVPTCASNGAEPVGVPRARCAILSSARCASRGRRGARSTACERCCRRGQLARVEPGQHRSSGLVWARALLLCACAARFNASVMCAEHPRAAARPEQRARQRPVT